MAFSLVDLRGSDSLQGIYGQVPVVSAGLFTGILLGDEEDIDVWGMPRRTVKGLPKFLPGVAVRYLPVLGQRATNRTQEPDSVQLANQKSPNSNDESLQRYKESLGLGGGKDLSDPNDPRVCVILSLTMDAPGRAPVTIDLSTPGSETTLKDHPFKIKESAKFTVTATFKVQHEILSGLHYVQLVKRKGIRVSKESEMIVCALVIV